MLTDPLGLQQQKKTINTNTKYIQNTIKQIGQIMKAHNKTSTCISLNKCNSKRMFLTELYTYKVRY